MCVCVGGVKGARACLPADRRGACCFLLGMLLQDMFRLTFHAEIKTAAKMEMKQINKIKIKKQLQLFRCERRIKE